MNRILSTLLALAPLMCAAHPPAESVIIANTPVPVTGTVSVGGTVPVSGAVTISNSSSAAVPVQGTVNAVQGGIPFQIQIDLPGTSIAHLINGSGKTAIIQFVSLDVYGGAGINPRIYIATQASNDSAASGITLTSASMNAGIGLTDYNEQTRVWIPLVNNGPEGQDTFTSGSGMVSVGWDAVAAIPVQLISAPGTGIDISWGNSNSAILPASCTLSGYMY